MSDGRRASRRQALLNYLLMTLPALMQEVHELKRFGVPPITARTVWMFGFQRRRVRRCECEMLLPKPGLLPQTSQLAATGARSRTDHRWPPAHAGDARTWPGRGQTIADPVVAGPTGGTPDRAPAAVDRLSAEDVRRWAGVALAELGRAREEIDALNVFPVADSDTGTNMYLTMESAAQAADALGPEADAAACVEAVVRGAMLGAWGNSGAILSQMLRGAGRALLAPVDPEAT